MAEIAQVSPLLKGGVVTEMFWVAEYNNGQCLPELDPFKGQVNSFSEVDHKKTIRFWWIPITPDMAARFPFTRVNPRFFTKDGKPNRHWVDLKGSRGFVSRRMFLKMGMGDNAKGVERGIKCYVIGIEGGPRQEIYPDGHVVNKLEPDRGETQDLLHH
jgi:hypothetical protein